MESPPPRDPVVPPLVRIGTEGLVLAGAALLLGGLTSFAQGVLPGVLRPLANSASGWTIPAALLVWALREGAGVAAVLGALAFELLVLGYMLVSQLRGIADSEVAFLLIGVTGGPIVGAAAAWLHERRWRPAVGAGVLAGVLLGDAAWGLGVVVASTGWVYWAVVAALGVVLLVAVAIGRGLRARELLLAVAATLGTALAFLAVYALLS